MSTELELALAPLEAEHAQHKAEKKEKKRYKAELKPSNCENKSVPLLVSMADSSEVWSTGAKRELIGSANHNGGLSQPKP